MAKPQCTDRVVGAILASWRYDISGISPEMCKDYEQHFADCSRCRARQKFHRSLDVALVALTSLSVFFSLFALAVLKHIKPLENVAISVLGLDKFDAYHMLVSAAIAGVCFSVIAFVLVLTATPVPSYLGGIAAERARILEERLPEAFERLPNAIKSLRPREQNSLQNQKAPDYFGGLFTCANRRSHLTSASAPADLLPSSPSAAPGSADSAVSGKYPSATHLVSADTGSHLR
jgi:hypothetical protein